MFHLEGRAEGGSHTPSVTLIIPCRNEERFLPALFACLDSQETEGFRVQTIFVDGCSTDDTRPLLQEYATSHPGAIVIDNPARIVPTAMNLGIRAAGGTLIVRLDAHSEYANDYVAKCLEYSRATGAENVGGPMRATGQGYVGESVALAHHSSFGLGGGKFHDERGEGEADTVYLGAFLPHTFTLAGLYDERLIRNQDIELNARIRKCRGRIFLTPNIRSIYHCRSTLGGLWRQNFANGVWAVYTRSVAPYALSMRHFVPAVFVASLSASVLLLLAIPLGPVRLLPIALVAGSYVLASLGFSLRIAQTKGVRFLPILPLVFGTLHFSYGIGSAWGLLTLRRWRRENHETQAGRVSSGGCCAEQKIPAGLSPRDRAIKRSFDLAVATIGLLLTGWIIGLAFLAATINTRRNGFFTQVRVGRYKRLFRVIKLRTMRELNGIETNVTTDNNPRITRVGRFLRKTKIDELPQLINVFKGDMSLVGPRPDVPGLADLLTGDDQLVLSVRPGITGPASLKYRSEEALLARQPEPERYNREVIYPDKVRLNVDYVRNYRFRQDIRYILQTLLAR